MSELKVTYRGVDVPERYQPNLGSSEITHFMEGVDAALAFATTDTVQICPPELDPFARRVLTDGDGDEWFQVEPGVFVIPDAGRTPEETCTRHVGAGETYDYIKSHFGIQSERPRV